MDKIIIDVREQDEFDAEYIENSIHIPLSCFHRQGPPLFRSLAGKTLVLMCASGSRARLAADQAKTYSSDVNLEIFHGGISEWKKQGNPIAVSRKAVLPIIRQVHLVAGLLVLSAAFLTHLVNPAFVLLAAFVGAGLTVSGATGFCGMARLLSLMPWNSRSC